MKSQVAVNSKGMERSFRKFTGISCKLICFRLRRPNSQRPRCCSETIYWWSYATDEPTERNWGSNSERAHHWEALDQHASSKTAGRRQYLHAKAESLRRSVSRTSGWRINSVPWPLARPKCPRVCEKRAFGERCCISPKEAIKTVYFSYALHWTHLQFAFAYFIAFS